MKAKLVKESLNESSKGIFFLKPIKDGEFGILDKDKNLVLSGGEASLSEIIRNNSGLSLLEVKSLFRNLLDGTAKIKVVTLDPKFMK